MMHSKKHAHKKMWDSPAGSTLTGIFFSTAAAVSGTSKDRGMEEGQLLLEPHHQGFGIRRLISKVWLAAGGH